MLTLSIICFLRLSFGITTDWAFEDKKKPTRTYFFWTIITVITAWNLSFPAAMIVLTSGTIWALYVISFTFKKEIEHDYVERNLAHAFEWFNENQWRGGQGDPLKIMFCKCNYEGLVEQYIKERKTTKTDNNEKP